MFNFTFGALLSGILLLSVYLFVFSKRRINDYRKGDQLARLIDQKNFEYLLIDIRSAEDYESAHIPTAVSIPYDKLVSALPVENMFLTIIVYGKNGKESLKAAEYLSDNGYFNVTSFGAFSRWKGEQIRIGMIGDSYLENTKKGRVDFPV